MPPDLALATPELIPRFPLLNGGTGLVLVDGEAGELRAFWRLTGADLMRAAAGFQPGGQRPRPVLRLRRRNAQGSEPAGEIGIRLVGAGGAGDQGFRVDPHTARYDAELGLSDQAGGWILLARSNAVDHAARVGLRLAARPLPRAAEPVHAVQDHALAPTAHAPSAGLDAADATPRVAAGQGAEPMPVAQHAPADRGVQAPVPDHGSDTGAQAESGRQPALGAVMPPLVYGQPAPGAVGPILEAELHLNGQAPPGMEIDLFGWPYRVGPGGRFHLVIRVDDPDLLRRALAAHPPRLPERALLDP
ncbi:MAG: hypothetical protein EOM91_04540 [Sphingobacteriia bacterium]|nr:hypothetical protein [Sphingobacteriia bacterium]NCC39113.1 hypothetical protein [Gammaproteobacteria bacterium]